jgi:hypothetical protein
MKKIFEDKHGWPIEEDAPVRKLKVIRSFWADDSSFYQVAFHLAKIHLFPGDQAKRQWIVSVQKHLDYILKNTADTRLSKQAPSKPFIYKWHKSVAQLVERIDQEFATAAENAWLSMDADSRKRAITDLIDRASGIRDIGFEVEQIEDPISGICLRVLENGKALKAV